MRSSYLAAVWFFVFGLFHLFWVSGSYIGLESEKAAEAFRRPWFYNYNLIATGFCFIGGLLSLQMNDVPKNSLFRKIILYVGGLVALLLFLRSLGAVVQATYLVVKGKFVVNAMQLWDVWFCAGTVLFLVTFLRYCQKVKTQHLRKRLSLR